MDRSFGTIRMLPKLTYSFLPNSQKFRHKPSDCKACKFF
ncbi:hypothetical protein HMPREF1042_1546 [Streptococcus constellatus subsp. pharyngis SK1060 = CCUG 46377]|uniref:Uncharacterized protein n=1 Tax=Streptococcus constellatus subsp. pharyngis SK1060 = CCUG 46377 TaxID=1035184 RepID=F9P8J1_STRCV|nr:hypothetical protein HMPREF1042_1546 [Streptococcus constellatus subsp. pharyngis SK1060 = CCUG 46377]